jgi:hypothetical protein
VLVNGLPPESATHTALRAEIAAEREEALARGDTPAEAEQPDPEGQRWSKAEMLLASLVDEVRILRFVYVSAHTEKGHKPPLPAPIPRPGVGKKETRPHASKLTTEQRARIDPRLRLAQRIEERQEAGGAA